MGGDDLGSDDEGWAAEVVASSSADESSAASDGGAASTPERSSTSPNKRRPDNNNSDQGGKPPKRKKLQSRDALLLEAGRNIEQQSLQAQAAFLTTAVKHYSLLSSDGDVSDETEAKSPTFSPQQFRSSSRGTLLERVKDLVSMKKLKKWKRKQSPYAVIICISARRAVAILKEVGALKVRVAKLFPKNASVNEQMEQLRSTPFGIAVGTPHRLTALSSSTPGNDEPAALNFEHTQLVIIDSMLSQKQYSVATLPDTAPHCMALLRDHILPELQRRQGGIHVAFL